ncbi:Uma2 family endonuclease [Streptomyces odontomachi]|uniref:Uma2 family endonuclease n=1 Tax=Streptomyces odontomachi TaxID=2944940 RepID=UPI00210E795B|nr:Uma2 family endonuclease [Streptomyces sp. ODS25]
MSALTVDHAWASGHEYTWDELVRIWEETDVPEGCTVEIIEGIVTVVPPPSNVHNLIADLVHRSLYNVIPVDWGVFQTLGTAVISRRGLFIPDIAVAPKAALLDAESEYYIPAAAAELVVEITSKSNAAADRITKTAGYAAAGVPFYLLIDAWSPGGPTVTLYQEPVGEVYRVHHAVKFGDTISIPKPIGLDLDTSEFPDGV